VPQIHVECKDQLIAHPVRISPPQLDHAETARGDVLIGVTGCLPTAKLGYRHSGGHAYDLLYWIAAPIMLDCIPMRSVFLPAGPVGPAPLVLIKPPHSVA
jgi:hypothetical protein